MRSLRIDAELEDRLQRAASITGESLSEFIRRAAAERADETLSLSRATEFGDVLGVVRGGGGRARRTGTAFTDLVTERSSGS